MTADTVMASAESKARFGDYLELTKPRLSMLSVITTLVGYASARPGWHPAEFWGLVAGTCACAGGVAALNQWMESDTDAIMPRTADRPIPSGKVATGSAFVIGIGLSMGGLGVLFTYTNGPASLFALLTIISYLAIYTPSKRWSRWSTEIGAVAGAFPPLIGWSAATGGVTELGWILFATLLLWQIPHFMAIAWTYRKDYGSVNFPMLPVRDSEGGKVARWSFVNSVLLIIVCLLPQPLGLASVYYTVVTSLLAVWFLARAAAFLRPTDRDRNARKLFFTTIGWLPLQLGALVADRFLFN
ncbi:MAG: heme o synthase [Opitutaceae bacterium]|jgi:protoheme IX farnesyltransferase